MHPELLTDWKCAKKAAAQLAWILKAEISQRGSEKIVRFNTGRETICATWFEVYGILASVRRDQIPMALPATAADLRGQRIVIKLGKLAGLTVEVIGPCPKLPETNAAVKTTNGQVWSVSLDRLR